MIYFTHFQTSPKIPNEG